MEKQFEKGDIIIPKQVDVYVDYIKYSKDFSAEVTFVYKNVKWLDLKVLTGSAESENGAFLYRHNNSFNVRVSAEHFILKDIEEDKRYHPFNVGDIVKMKPSRRVSRGKEIGQDVRCKVTRLDGFTNAQVEILEGNIRMNTELLHPGTRIPVYLDAFEFAKTFRIWF